jgi:hypothetical protein
MLLKDKLDERLNSFKTIVLNYYYFSHRDSV